MWQAGSAAVARGQPPRRPPRPHRPRRRRTLEEGPARAGRPGTTTSRGKQPMSAIRQTNSKSLMLFSGRAYPELTDEIGGHLGVMPTPTAAYEFANGELFVRFEESV